jgi:hypothetical protein
VAAYCTSASDDDVELGHGRPEETIAAGKALLASAPVRGRMTCLIANPTGPASRRDR